MSVRNAAAFRRRPDFSQFDGCFGKSNIQFTDMDAVVEHQNLFLTVEFKGLGGKVTLGQRIYFDACVRQGIAIEYEDGEDRRARFFPTHTVILAEGDYVGEANAAGLSFFAPAQITLWPGSEWAPLPNTETSLEAWIFDWYHHAEYADHRRKYPDHVGPQRCFGLGTVHVPRKVA